MWDFLMPENKRDEGENPIVDSLAISSKWTIVSKCALHGLIYIWDLKETLREAPPGDASGEGDDIVERDVVMLAKLRW